MALGHVTTGSNHITVGVVDPTMGMVEDLLVTGIQTGFLVVALPRIGGTNCYEASTTSYCLFFVC